MFRDTLIGNIQEFINTFNQRNLLGDEELAYLVEKAKEILVGVNANLLRQDGSTRDRIQKQFADIDATLATMVTTKITRKFDLE